MYDDRYSKDNGSNDEIHDTFVDELIGNSSQPSFHRMRNGQCHTQDYRLEERSYCHHSLSFFFFFFC